MALDEVNRADAANAKFALCGARYRTGKSEDMLKFQGEVARLTGLEPATSGVTGRHSNQLSYNRADRDVARRAAF